MKAQFWSFDIIFAIIIFVFAVIILTVVWIDVSGQFAIAYGSNLINMQSQVQSLSAQILSPGTPANWNYLVNFNSPAGWSNFSIGLSNGTVGVLSQKKINTLANMSRINYQDTKPPLGIGFDYYITILGSGINNSIGFNPGLTNVTSVQVTTIPAVLNGNTVRVQIQLWSNSTLGIE